jgi:hypothetical protein
MLEAIWNSVKAKWPPNRAFGALMVVGTPALAIVSGWVATRATTLGLHFTQGEVFGVFLAGATAVVLPAITFAYKWMSGWIQHEGAKQRKEVALIEAGHQTTLNPEDTL